ncbi:MAG: dTMP kinase [Clostridiaceae bacterium]|nr:dTMP kinase [Clostridiaceae bacterium]
MKRGLLITFEGPDGSGKSTQVELLKKYLKDRGYEVIFTREPGGTFIGEKIRNIILDNKNADMNAMCEALLYAASRAQLVSEIVKPAINAGKIVICDRFVHSSIVYQGIARNLGIERIKGINDAALDGLEADLIFMLNISFEEGLKRKALQKEFDRLENSGDEFHKNVFLGYEVIGKTYSNINNIDASKDEHLIHEDIIKILQSKLN